MRNNTDHQSTYFTNPFRTEQMRQVIAYSVRKYVEILTWGPWTTSAKNAREWLDEYVGANLTDEEIFKLMRIIKTIEEEFSQEVKEQA